jgi:hypothetical protein
MTADEVESCDEEIMDGNMDAQEQSQGALRPYDAEGAARSIAKFAGHHCPFSHAPSSAKPRRHQAKTPLALYNRSPHTI